MKHTLTLYFVLEDFSHSIFYRYHAKQRVNFSSLSFNSDVAQDVVLTVTGFVMARMTAAMRQTSVTVPDDLAEPTSSAVAMATVL